jgi:hypothetical protein
MPVRKRVDKPAPGSHKLDLSGQKFHDLTVVKFAGKNSYQNKMWECECVCGKRIEVSATVLRQGRKKSCGCSRYLKGSAVYNYSGFEDITGTRFNAIRSSAVTRGIAFRISKEEIWGQLMSQGSRCALTGLPVTFKDSSASVDRVDPKGSYEPSNIQIVHQDVNLMRNKFTVERFVEVCKLVARHLDEVE